MGRVVVSVAAALTAAMVPVFLLGALSADLGADFGLDETAIGAIVTVLFLTAAVTATPAGALAERVGGIHSLRGGVALAGLVCVVVGLLSVGWWSLLVPLALVGVAVALVDTGAARTFADHLPGGQHGRAFGLKEASVPAASMLAGVAVPVLAAPFGWRVAFMAGASVAVAVLVALRGVTRTPPAPGLAPDDPDGADGAETHGADGGEAHGEGASGGRMPAPEMPAPEIPALVAGPPTGSSTALLIFAVGVGLGAGAATAAATFLVPALVAVGLSPGPAGLALAAASVASIVARITTGRWADRADASPSAAIVSFCLLGALGALVLVAGPAPAVAVVAAIAVLGAGWGWTGLAFLTAVRARPHAPATAAGVVLTGLGLGGALGPLAFGALASRVSWAAAWTLVAVGLSLAGAAVVAVRAALVPTAAPTVGRG